MRGGFIQVLNELGEQVDDEQSRLFFKMMMNALETFSDCLKKQKDESGIDNNSSPENVGDDT